MASIQAPTTAWMAYSDATILPPSSVYVGTFRVNEPSYVHLSSTNQPDNTLAQALEPISQLTFLKEYFAFEKAFSEDDYSTLFIPLQDSFIEELSTIRQNASLGFSYKDRKVKTEAQTRVEELLLRHMVPVKIQPKQIEYRNTRIATLGGTIQVNEKGEINNGVSTILQYIDLPRTTVFLISKEISS
jgi:hypothetical protein